MAPATSIWAWTFRSLLLEEVSYAAFERAGAAVTEEDVVQSSCRMHDRVLVFAVSATICGVATI